MGDIVSDARMLLAGNPVAEEIIDVVSQVPEYDDHRCGPCHVEPRYENWLCSADQMALIDWKNYVLAPVDVALAAMAYEAIREGHTDLARCCVEASVDAALFSWGILLFLLRGAVQAYGSGEKMEAMELIASVLDRLSEVSESLHQ